MKLIKCWHVKLYRYVPGLSVNTKLLISSPKRGELVCEGYSKDKPVLKNHDEGLIELFTSPDNLETNTIRTRGIDSMVCTPVYEKEKEQDSIEPNKHLLKSEFFTIEFQIPNADDLNKIFAEVCKDVLPLAPTTEVFRVVFNEMLSRVRASILASITTHPESLHNLNAMHDKRINPVEKI